MNRTVNNINSFNSLAFVPTLEKCREELLSVLEDWILVGLRLGHPLPVVAVVGGIDLNKETKNTLKVRTGSARFCEVMHYLAR